MIDNTRTGEPYHVVFGRVIGRPDTMQDIFSHLANGGALTELASAWSIRYSDLMWWIKNDKERKALHLAAMDARMEWAKERVLAELRLLALSDPRAAFNKRGGLLDMSEIPEATARSIQSIEVEELFGMVDDVKQQIGVTKKVKFWDKKAAIELSMKEMGLLVNKVQVQMVKSLEDLVAESNGPEIIVEEGHPTAPVPGDFSPPILISDHSHAVQNPDENKKDFLPDAPQGTGIETNAEKIPQKISSEKPIEMPQP